MSTATSPQSNASLPHADIIALLRGCPYWSALSDADLQALAQAVIVRHYPAGTHLFAEGDAPEQAALHLVASGLVRIYKLSAEGREQVLRLFRPGDTFADVPAFDGGPYPAHAATLEDSVVLLLPRQRLVALMQAHPTITLGALRVMAGRLRHMTALVEDLSLHRVSSRLARLLLTQPAASSMPQGQLATMVGTAREMVNRALRSMADDGVIALQGGAIQIVDHERLRAVADAG